MNEYGLWVKESSIDGLMFLRQFEATSRRRAVRIAKERWLNDKDEFAIRILTDREAKSAHQPTY